MGTLKRVELLAKLVLAAVAAALLWRPWRQRSTGRAARVLLVRIDDRVGEALLTTPLLSALRRLSPPPEVWALVHHKAVRVLDGHPEVDGVLPFDRRLLWLGPLAPGVRALRREAFDAVVNCTSWDAPSVTQSIVSRLIARRAAVIGPSAGPARWLSDIAVVLPGCATSEVERRRHLLSPLGDFGPAGSLSFRRPRPPAELAPLLAQVRASPHAVVNPGGRLGWRRIPPEAFAAAASALMAEGRRPLVTWGPGEEELARVVVAHARGALLAPPTDLDGLAALMESAGLTVSNNTGPMHLSVAVGVPTLGLFLRMPPERWGHPRPPHRMVDLTPFARAPGELCEQVSEAVRSFARWVAQQPAERTG